ncbi:hypothetical protein [Burkholderia gladioli]|uniref:hypothetical protein n=1 Tax=Burkholderia gladioli TaxID=28095 RepID=UPI00163E0103|nr:hypothetical protein [Burkholderia gladioli]
MDEQTQSEIKARTEWRKYIVYERHDEMFIGDTFAGVFCIREVSGYGVWYVRQLDQEGESAPVADGKFLLRFFAPAARHEAIEFAVLTAAAGGGANPETVIARLDGLASEGCRVSGGESSGPPFEQIR